MIALLVLLSAAWATCESPDRFDFTGQPDCVSLSFDGERTQLRNDCAQALLVDHSVTLGQAPLIEAGAEVTLRDLNAFTLGMDGELFRVVAVWAEDACAVSAPAPKPGAKPAPLPSPIGGLTAWFEGAWSILAGIWAG